MAETWLYKLHPRGPFHFGERGIGVEETADMLHADTLFSAIVSAWRALGQRPSAQDGNLPAIQPFMAGNPPWRISSGLPFAGDLLLLPCPPLLHGVSKVLKRVAFVSPAALAKICNPETLDLDRIEPDLIQGGSVWVLPEEFDQIMTLRLAAISDDREREQQRIRYQRDPASLRLWWGGDDAPVPRVALDRLNLTSNLYYTGQLRFAPGCGLYVLAAYHDPQSRTGLEAALAFLSDAGLGGRRTSGHGQFILTQQEYAFPTVPDANAALLLSLYLPTAAEVAGGILRDARYQRILRRGWISSPDGNTLRRKAVWMIREGAVVRQPAGGRIIDVQPDGVPVESALGHPVWRYGYGLTLPIALQETL